jgi:DNA (cytosine-5)-methyltransferase 1
MIVVGWRKDSGLKYSNFYEIKTDAVVDELFTDLPKLQPRESCNKYVDGGSANIRSSTFPYVLWIQKSNLNH